MILRNILVDGQYYPQVRTIPPKKTPNSDTGQNDTTIQVNYKVRSDTDPGEAAEVIHRDLIFQASRNNRPVPDAFIPTAQEIQQKIINVQQANTPKKAPAPEPAKNPKTAVQMVGKPINVPKSWTTPSPPQPQNQAQDVPVFDAYHPSWKEKIERTLESAWDKTFFGIFENRLKQSMATEKNPAVRFFGGLAYSLDLPAMTKDAAVFTMNLEKSPLKTIKEAGKSLKDPFTWGVLFGGAGTASALSEGLSLAFDKPQVKLGVETEKGKVIGLKEGGEYSYASAKAYVKKISQEKTTTKGVGLEIGVSGNEINTGVFRFAEAQAGEDAVFTSHFFGPRFEEFQQGITKVGKSGRATAGTIVRKQENTITAERFLSFGKSKDVGTRRYSVDLIQTESGKTYLAGAVNTEKELPLKLALQGQAKAAATAELDVLPTTRVGTGTDVIGPLRISRGGLEFDIGAPTAVGAFSAEPKPKQSNYSFTSTKIKTDNVRVQSTSEEFKIPIHLDIPKPKPSPMKQKIIIKQKQIQDQDQLQDQDLDLDFDFRRDQDPSNTQSTAQIRLVSQRFDFSIRLGQMQKPKQEQEQVEILKTGTTQTFKLEFKRQQPKFEVETPRFGDSTMRQAPKPPKRAPRPKTTKGGILIPAGEIDLFAADELDAMGVTAVTVNMKKFIEHYEGPTGLFDEPLWLTEEFGSKKKRREKKKKKRGFTFDLAI